MRKQPIRKIVHIDMDAFYAAIEQCDRPELRGKPIIAGGQPDKRGVVATCSYKYQKIDRQRDHHYPCGFVEKGAQATREVKSLSIEVLEDLHALFNSLGIFCDGTAKIVALFI